MKRNRLLVVLAVVACLSTPLFAGRPGNYVDRPWMYSVLYPFVFMPTQAFAGMTGAGTAYGAVFDVGPYYYKSATLSLCLKPGLYAGSAGTEGFLMNRWYFHTPDLEGAAQVHSDRNCITMGVGLGGYALNYARTNQAAKYHFGPAVTFNWGVNIGTSWDWDIRALFQLEGTLGLLNDDNIVNMHATGSGVTIGFWGPADVGWIFPGP